MGKEEKDKEEKDKEEKDKDEKHKEDKGDKDKDAKEGAKDEKKEPEEKGERKRDRDGRPTKKLDPRSRNIFGKMLGHLHSAKSRLDTEKSSQGRVLQDKALVRTEEKIQMGKINIKEFRKEKF